MCEFCEEFVANKVAQGSAEPRVTQLADIDTLLRIAEEFPKALVVVFEKFGPVNIMDVKIVEPWVRPYIDWSLDKVESDRAALKKLYDLESAKHPRPEEMVFGIKGDMSGVSSMANLLALVELFKAP